MRKLVFFLLMLGFHSFLFADFKLMGGLNLSQYSVLWDDENQDWSSKLGFLGGIGLEKRFTHNILLEFNFLYCQKGSKVEFTSSDPSSARYSLAVFSVPVLLRIKNKLAYGSSLYFVGGGELSTLISHSEKLDDKEASDIKKKTKSLDYGLVFGGGYEIELKEFLFFFIEGRYYHGLRNILVSPSGSESWKTRGIFILIGVRS